jgi:hypothetical protein
MVPPQFDEQFLAWFRKRTEKSWSRYKLKDFDTDWQDQSDGYAEKQGTGAIATVTQQPPQQAVFWIQAQGKIHKMCNCGHSCPACRFTKSR